MLFQHIGETADIFVKFTVGDLFIYVRVVAFPDDGDLVTTAFQVAVDTVVGDVGHAIFIPLDRYVAVEISVLDFGKGLEPVNASAVLGPEAIRVGYAFIVPVEIGLVVNERVLLCPRQNGVKLFRHVFLHNCPAILPPESTARIGAKPSPDSSTFRRVQRKLDIGIDYGPQ